MPTSRSKRTRQTPGRKTRAGASSSNATRRKKRATARQQAKGASPPARDKKKRASGAGLASWRELAAGNERAARRPPVNAYIENVSTIRFGLALLALAAVFTLYIGHVHATQDVLAELQQARRANLRLHLTANHLRGDFDRATGPAVVYRRARALGLEEGVAYGPSITVDADR